MYQLVIVDTGSGEVAAQVTDAEDDLLEYDLAKPFAAAALLDDLAKAMHEVRERAEERAWDRHTRE